MRLIHLFFILLLGAVSGYAQNRAEYFKFYPDHISSEWPEWAKLMYAEDPNVFEVEAAYRAFRLKEVFVKDNHVRNFTHWRRMVAPYVNNNGKIRPPAPEEEAKRVQRIRQNRVTTEQANTWRSLGPVETYQPVSLLPISWQVNVYAVDQSLSHPDRMIAGTEVGGIFISNDKGLHWEPVAQDQDIWTVHAVSIHPSDPDIMFAMANRRIFRTLDGGMQWSEVAILDGVGHEFTFLLDQPDTIFYAASNGLYVSHNGGAEWSKIWSESTWDIKQHLRDQDTLYAVASDTEMNRSVFYRSLDRGETWEKQEMGWYSPEVPEEANEAGAKIGLTSANPDRIYAALIGDSKEGDNGWIGLYRSDDNGSSWTLPAGQIGSPYQSVNNMPWNVAAYTSGYHQGFFNFAVGVSPKDQDLVWIGTIRLTETRDGGASFQAIGAANSQRLDLIHADIQDILVRGDDIWIASDGGLNYSTDDLQSHHSRKKGIIGSDFWGFGSGWNEDVLVGGKYHNGNSLFYQSYEQGDYLHEGGVEEATGYVHPLENRKAYFSKWWTGGVTATIMPDSFHKPLQSAAPITLLPNESYVESSSSGIYFDFRYANRLYMGVDGGFWRSEDGGATFEQLYDFGEGQVYEIAQSRANPDVFYLVYQPGTFWDESKIYRTMDGGQNWEEVTEIPGYAWRLEISLNPEDPMEIWVASSRGEDERKVFRSYNGGQDWENISSDRLDGQRMKDICFQGGTEETVYLATDYSIYYWNGADWEPFSSGLPLRSNAFELRPFYRDGKLRLATYGKGIWETDLVTTSRPLAQIMTESDKIFCARDTVVFSCYSILGHELAEWSWNFDPKPVYISDSTATQVQVVFGEEGTYTARLNIQNGQGVSDEYILSEGVEVIDYCAPDPEIGLNAHLSEPGDYVQMDDLDLNSNSFTIATWIFSEKDQDSYSGIAINDGSDIAGLNFRVDNVLGYHWPGGAWWWDSGLEVPVGEWSHVAMVVEPDGITLYLNGVSSKHFFTVEPVNFSAVKLGNYRGNSSRNFIGKMDEVSFWDRPLSQNEIRAMRHLTLKGDEEGLHAYLQFNEPEGRVNDKVGFHHARLNGGAQRSFSDAPAGPGASILWEPDSAGWATWPELGLSVDLFQSPVHPAQICWTLIQAAPDVAEFEHQAYYWISDVYQEQQEDIFFAEAQLEKEEIFMGQKVRADLYERSPNGFGPVWERKCSGESATDDVHIVFTDTCDLLADAQWILGDAEAVVSQANRVYEELSVFPNPVVRYDELSIEGLEGVSGELQIFNAKGQMVWRQTIQGVGRYQLDLSPFESGSYFFRWKTDDRMRHGQFIIME